MTSDRKIICAVQGTQEAVDWLTNVKIRKTKYFGIHAHRGFVGAAQAILAEVESAIYSFPEYYQILVAGHSLGGGVGVLLSIGLQELMRMRAEQRRITLTTFGQPKVATSKALRVFHGSYMRVQNGSDIVPRLPNVPGYYSHAGTNLYLPNKLPEPIINPSWSVRFKDRMLTGFERLQDHSMDDYIKELRKCESVL